MIDINKKVRPEYFQTLLEHRKPFEVYLANVPLQVGDLMRLFEWSPETGYTGRFVERCVSCVLPLRDLSFWSAEEVEQHGLQVIGFESAAPALFAELEGLRERHAITLQERDRYRHTAEQRISVREELADLLGTEDIAQAVAEVKRLQGEVEDAQAEVRRLQAEAVAAGRAAQERVDDMESEMESEVNAAYNRGREEMWERAAGACAALRETPNACTCSGGRSGRHHSPYCEGWQDGLDYAESTIQALEVQP